MKPKSSHISEPDCTVYSYYRNIAHPVLHYKFCSSEMRLLISLRWLNAHLR